MASKLCFVLLASSLPLLLVTADASIIRTTVAEIEEENPSMKGSCRQQFRGMDLTPCMRWMSRSTGGGWELVETEEGMNPRGGSSSQFKNQCCSMMSKMDDECMCDALKGMLREECMSGSMSYQGQGGSSKMRGLRIMEKMMNVHGCAA